MSVMVRRTFTRVCRPVFSHSLVNKGCTRVMNKPKIFSRTGCSCGGAPCTAHNTQQPPRVAPDLRFDILSPQPSGPSLSRMQIPHHSASTYLCVSSHTHSRKRSSGFGVRTCSRLGDGSVPQMCLRLLPMPADPPGEGDARRPGARRRTRLQSFAEADGRHTIKLGVQAMRERMRTAAAMRLHLLSGGGGDILLHGAKMQAEAGHPSARMISTPHSRDPRLAGVYLWLPHVRSASRIPVETKSLSSLVGRHREPGAQRRSEFRTPSSEHGGVRQCDRADLECVAGLP